MGEVAVVPVKLRGEGNAEVEVRAVYHLREREHHVRETCYHPRNQTQHIWVPYSKQVREGYI